MKKRNLIKLGVISLILILIVINLLVGLLISWDIARVPWDFFRDEMVE